MKLLPPFLSLAASLLLANFVQAEPLKWSPGGFQIEPLSVTSDFAAGQVLAMSLPAKDGFSSNVNVMAQPFTGSIDQYIGITRQQFSSASVKVLWERRANDAEWICEYQGSFSGRAMHWYGRVVLVPGKALLTTATAAEAEWPAIGAQMKKCVDSFKPTP